MSGVIAAALATLAQLGADVAVLQSSAAGDEWAPQAALSWGADFPAAVDVTVNRTVTHQTIMGFGAAFTDTSAYNVEVWMNPQVKEELLQAYWGPAGLGYTIGRVPINSPDYAFETFNYDNTTDDFLLRDFDHAVKYDQQRVIPFIKHAMSTSADPIKLFGSPWSPPGWFKTNDNMINCKTPCLKDDAPGGSYKATWAAYIVAWLQAFAAQGLPMWGLTPQNEPLACQTKFESCGYTPAGMAEFIGKYLGPAVKTAYPDLQIMLYDHNK